MKIIDSHNHINFHGITVAKAIADMDAQGIDQAWLLSWETPSDEIDQDMYRQAFPPHLDNIPFPCVLESAERYPGRFIIGYCPDPRRADALDKLEHSFNCYGVQVCGELKLRMMYDNPDAIALYKLCGKLGLPVVVHIDYPIALRSGHYPRQNYWYGGGIDALERALQQVPETNFLGHAPGFWGHISDDDQQLREIYPSGKVIRGGKVERMLRTYENLYGDLSAYSCLNALQRDLSYTREFLDEFQDRLLFARDCYTNDLYDFLESLELPLTIKEKIYYRNAERLVN